MKKFYWLKERITPQAHYFVACGQITVKEARDMENPLYGDNIMTRYKTEQEYIDKITELQEAGFSVHIR